MHCTLLQPWRLSRWTSQTNNLWDHCTALPTKRASLPFVIAKSNGGPTKLLYLLKNIFICILLVAVDTFISLDIVISTAIGHGSRSHGKLNQLLVWVTQEITNKDEIPIWIYWTTITMTRSVSNLPDADSSLEQLWPQLTGNI